MNWLNLNPEKIVTSLKTAWDNYGEYISVPPIFMATYKSVVADESIKLLFALFTAALSTIVIMWTKDRYGNHLAKKKKKKHDEKL